MSQTEKPGYRRLQVTDQESMTWENDRLDRKQYAERLTTLIGNTEGPYVIGLTSPWGSGKTFFLQAWHKQLLADGKPCIYFNAWEMDASGDPLANLFAVSEQQADRFQGLSEKLKKRIKTLFKHLPAMIRGAAFLGNVFSLGINGKWVGIVANVIESIQKILAKKRNFKKELAAIASQIAEDKRFPLFIIVDELDRCRPSYAIDLLESIKHLFHVPHVVFLLAVDSTQLLQQVEHTFGLKCSDEANMRHDYRRDYLDKFFDVYYQLPSPENDAFLSMLLKNSARLSFYDKQCVKKNNISAELKIFKILLVDRELFEKKSLRRLVQDTEMFLLFLRCYDDLGIEEIMFAFFVIMKCEERGVYNGNYRHEFDKCANDFLISCRKIVDSLSRNIGKVDDFYDRDLEVDRFYKSMSLIIKAMMNGCGTIDDNIVTAVSIKYFRGGPITDKIIRLNDFKIKTTSEIAPVVLDRLRYLADFSPSLEDSNEGRLSEGTGSRGF